MVDLKQGLDFSQDAEKKIEPFPRKLAMGMQLFMELIATAEMPAQQQQNMIRYS